VKARLEPGGDGGTDVHVRVVEWFVFLVPGLLLILGVCLTAKAPTGAEVLKGAAMTLWVFLIAAGLYFLEAHFVRRIFVRVLGGNPGAA
jgi:hypothetical protein